MIALGCLNRSLKVVLGAQSLHRMMSVRTFQVDDFCLRQFESSEYAGTTIDMDVKAFEKKINDIFDAGEAKLVDGYAPFCKHLFVKNFTNAKTGDLEITTDNESMLRTLYEARTEKELPVLIRYFPREACDTPVGEYLDVICYSKEQIKKENAAMGKPCTCESEWGIISVKAQMTDHELPMQPITIMRNSLGKDEGGSGVPLDRQKYLQSVEYWRNRATVR